MADADSPELIAAINRLTETVATTAGAGGGVGSGISREELEAIRTGDTEREKSLRKQREMIQDISSTANLMGSYFGNITDEITGSSAGIENMVRGIDKSIVSAVKLVKHFKNLKVLGEGLKKIFGGFVGILSSGVIKAISGFAGFIKDLVVGADEFKKVAAAATGTATGMASAFTRLRKAAVDTGNSLLKPTEAFLKMRNQLPMLGKSATETAERMALMASRLEILGFSADNQVKNFSILRTTFGATEREAEMANVAFQQMAERFNMTGDQISQGFQEATQQIGQFGKEVFKSFPKLQAFAKKTGASLNSMLGIINKFNTFEDAASSVGQLNAILGGPFLDSIELLQKEDPAEIIGDIVGAFDDAGMDMQRSGRHMRYAVSQILGVSADEAARLLSGGADAFGEATITAEDAAKITADSVTALIANSDRAMSRMDKLAGQFAKLANSIDDAFGISGFLNNALDSLVVKITEFIETDLPQLITQMKNVISSIKKVIESPEEATAGALDMGIAGTIAGGALGTAGILAAGLAAPVAIPTALGIAAGGAVLGGIGFAGKQIYDNIQGRANGGPVNMGQPYLVGERGQELFVPSQSGTIQSSDSYLTKKDFEEGINALVGAFNVEVVMDGRAVGKIVTKEQNRAFVGGYDRLNG